jgi:hypothetical protein
MLYVRTHLLDEKKYVSDVFRLGDEVAQMLPLRYGLLDQRNNCNATGRVLCGETLPDDALKSALG